MNLKLSRGILIVLSVVIFVNNSCQSTNRDLEQTEIADKVQVIPDESTAIKPFIPSPSPEPTLPPEEQDLMKLLDEAKIEVQISGRGISSIQINIRRLVDEHILVSVLPGTYFWAVNTGTQNMVATTTSNILLDADSWEWISVPVACADIDLGVPASNDTFFIRPLSGNTELTQVLTYLPVDQSISHDILQAIVWILTDDADYNDLGRLVVSSALSLSGTRAINNGETLDAMRWIDQAGVDITQKSIWKNREMLINGIDDADLIAWIDQKKSELPQPERSIPIGHAFSTYRFSPDGISLAIGGEDGVVELWYVQSTEKYVELGGIDWSIKKLDFSADGSLLAAHGNNGQVIVWEVESQRAIFNYESYSVQGMALSQDGAKIAIITGAQMWIWDLSSNQVIDKFGEFYETEDLRFMPDGESIAVVMDYPVAGFDSTVRFWSLSNRVPTRTFSIFQTQIGLSLDLSPDGRLLAYGARKNDNYVINIWDLETQQILTLEGIFDFAELKFSPDGTTLAAATGSTIKVWSLETWEEFQMIEVEGYFSNLFVPKLGFTADGSYLAVGVGEEILLWNNQQQ